MSELFDCKACETLFSAHPDERGSILLSQLNALHSKYTRHVANHALAAAEERGFRRGVEEAAKYVSKGGLTDVADGIRLWVRLAPREAKESKP